VVGEQGRTPKVTLEIDGDEVERMRAMMRERIDMEWEEAEDLRALGRPFDEPLKRLALVMRIDAALGTTKAPA
jgi:hypothetical protein